MSDDPKDAKKLILARRARFVAAAMASLAAPACGKTSAPIAADAGVVEAGASSPGGGPGAVPPIFDPNNPPSEPPNTGVVGEPRACLSIAPVDRDAGPRPCLRPALPSCNPPYTIDANGKKRFKRECL